MGMKKRPEPEVREIRMLNVIPHYYELSIREPCGDNWDCGDYDCEFTHVTAEIVTYKTNYRYEEKLPKVGAWIWVVLEICDTGSTFGSTTNVPYFRQWFDTEKEAEIWTETAPKDNDYFGGHVRWQIEKVQVTEALC